MRAVGPLFFASRFASSSHLSFLQHRGLGDWGEDDTEQKLCTFQPPSGSDRLIKVFADTSDNTRYVQFAREGYISDDGYVETMVKCKGPIAASCLQKSSSSAPGSCVSCPCEFDSSHPPYGNYQVRMLALLVPQCQAHNGVDGKEPFRVLIVGLGGGALAQYVLDRCPSGTVVEAVEYDARMIEVATQFFGLRLESGRFEVDQGDGGAIVADRAKAKQSYNFVLVDAYEGGPHVPESCRNAKFVQDVRHILRPNGTALHNIKVDYEAALPLYKTEFGDVSVRGEDLSGHDETLSHLIVAKASS